MARKSVESRIIVKKLIDQDRATKRKNTTFRLPEQLVSRFRENCHAQGVQPADVLTELMRRFLGDGDLDNVG